MEDRPTISQQQSIDTCNDCSRHPLLATPKLGEGGPGRYR